MERTILSILENHNSQTSNDLPMDFLRDHAIICDEKIKPLYEESKYADCHGWNHAMDVFQRYLEFCDHVKVEDIRISLTTEEMIKVMYIVGMYAAVTHDISLSLYDNGRKEHHIHSSKWVDDNLHIIIKKHFSDNGGYKDTLPIIFCTVNVSNFVMTHRSSNDLCERLYMLPELRYLCRIFNDADSYCVMLPEEKMDRYLNVDRFKKGFHKVKKEIYTSFKKKYGLDGYAKPKSDLVELLIAEGKIPELAQLSAITENEDRFYNLLYKRWVLRYGTGV